MSPLGELLLKAESLLKSKNILIIKMQEMAYSKVSLLEEEEKNSGYWSNE